MILDKFIRNHLHVETVTSEDYLMEDTCKNRDASKQIIFKL